MSAIAAHQAVPGARVPDAQPGEAGPSATYYPTEASNPLQSAIATGVQGFRNKPAQSGILVGAIFLLLFLIIAAWTPWWGFRTKDFDTGSQKAHQVGQFLPLTAEVCTFEEGRKRTDDLDGVQCSSIQLVVVRKKLDYFRRAGGVAFAFTFLATLMGAFAAFVSFVRRRGRLYYDIPEPLAYLRVREAAPGLFGGIALCMLLGWASYAGVVNSSLDKDELSMQLAGGLDLDRAGFRGGFILAVLSTVLSGVLAGLSYVYHDEGEAERAAQDAALAHAVATGGAVPGAGAGVGQQVGMPSSMASSASGAAAPSAPFPPTGTPPTANSEEHPFAEGGGQDYEAAQGQGHSAAGSSTVNPVTAAMAQAAPSSPPADQTDDSMGNPFGEEPAL